MKVLFQEEITLVTLQNTPASISFVSEILKTIADLAVNVDMISQEPPQSEHSSLSFTIADDDLGKILTLTSGLRERYPQIKPVISSGNGKITAFDESMRTKPGVAAAFFDALAPLNPDIRIITTSEVEISVLVTKDQAGQALTRIQESFQA